MEASNSKILWNNFKMPWTKAEHLLSVLVQDDDDYNSISNKVDLPDKKLETFRTIIKEKYDEYRKEYKKYELDYRIALFFYEMTSPQKNNEFAISISEASNNSFWRYLSTVIFPDIVFERWYDKDKKNISYDHYGKKPSKNYFRSLWWYIHLSWQEDISQTQKILEHNSTDTIMNLVERPGQGYFVELDRQIMKKYSQYVDVANKGMHFRNVLKINNAYLVTMNPYFFDGGIESYVNNLFTTANVK